MRKILILILAVIMLFSVVACQEKKSDKEIKSKAEVETKAEKEKNTEKEKKVETKAEPKESKSTVYPFTFKDAKGRDVTIDKKPEKVIPLTGTTLGLFSKVGGKAIASADLSDNAPKPDYYSEIEHLGHMASIDVEKLVSLSPDFVMVQGMQAKILPVLEQNNINYLFFGAKTYKEVQDSIKLFAKINDSNDIADEIINKMDAKKEEIIAKLPSNDERKIAIVYVTGRGISLKLSNSIAGDVANLLGVKNITEGTKPEKMGSDSTPFDLEAIVAANPDAIFVTSMIPSDEKIEDVLLKHIKDNDAWKAVPAIKNKKLYFLPQSHFLFNPLDKYPEAMEMMAKDLWPKAFE